MHVLIARREGYTWMWDLEGRSTYANYKWSIIISIIIRVIRVKDVSEILEIWSAKKSLEAKFLPAFPISSVYESFFRHGERHLEKYGSYKDRFLVAVGVHKWNTTFNVRGMRRMMMMQ